MSGEMRKNQPSVQRNSKRDFTDITLFGTPLPQAASTAKRNSTFVFSKHENYYFNYFISHHFLTLFLVFLQNTVQMQIITKDRL